jgi:hypothetical protein
VIWLLRRLKPDFKTIADFRRDNRAAFRSMFRQFVVLCRRLDLYGRELLAVDGTRIKAVNNKDLNFTRNSLERFIRAADERLDDYLRRLDEGDVTESGTGGGARTNNLGPEDRGPPRQALTICGDAGGIGAKRREPDIADRSRQSGDGRPYEDRRRLQRAGRGRRRLPGLPGLKIGGVFETTAAR